MNDMYVIRRPPTDRLTYDLVHELTASITVPWEGCYIWTDNPKYFYTFCKYQGFKAPLVVIAVKDHLDNLYEYNYWHHERQSGCQALVDMVNNHPDSHFVIFNSYENLHKEISHPRITLIPYGGDIVNQHYDYGDIEPAIEKNFDDHRHVMCLNRMDRDHRIIMLSYLYGLNIQHHVYLTFLGLRSLVQSKPEVRAHFLNRIPWEFSERHDNHRAILFAGYQHLVNDQTLLDDNFDIYGKRTNDNRMNFDNTLQHRYRRSVVEIINETTFTSPAFMLTEKTLHAFHGCVFPILLSGPGAVQHLRDIGFDMFDDIVDHDYDHMVDPFDRLLAAVDLNYKLLTDRSHAILQWQACQSRFLYNSNLAKSIYTWYNQRTKLLWQDFCQTQLHLLAE